MTADPAPAADPVEAAGSAGASAPAASTTVLQGLVRSARPRQWLKNVLVLAAPGAAGVLDNVDAAWRVAVAFLAFSATASALYLRNDIADIERDRRHPRKRLRPIAAGIVPVPVAKRTSLLLGVVGLLLAAATLRWQFVVALVIYIALTTSYTAYFKHRVVLDLACVAGGFMVRAIAGASAAAVPVSDWFLICTSFGSLFVVSAKRFAEQSRMQDQAATSRSTLAIYTTGYLRMVMGVCLAVTSIAYCLWAFEKAAIYRHRFPYYELSIVPMVIALLRYAIEVEAGAGEAPEDLFVADRTLQVLGLLWLGLFSLGIYVG